MTEPSPANLELAIALPLGVVANQLARIEADLRFLSMKASAYSKERESGQLAAKVSGGLEKINGKSSGERASRKSSADRDD
jgi:hypothetical protein